MDTIPALCLLLLLRAWVNAIANGGRYDDVGHVFGRARPATGFAVNITRLVELLDRQPLAAGIYAPHSESKSQWRVIQQLRAQGERVVCGFVGQQPCFTELQCDRELRCLDDDYQIINIE